MPYESLQQNQKQPIDNLYNAIMQHKRTILAVSSMAPKLLDKPTQQADAAAGQELPLASTVRQIGEQVRQLDQQMKSLRENMMHTKRQYETSTTQAISFAQWPTEFVATRAGVTLTTKPTTSTSSSEEEKKKEEFYMNLKKLLDREMTRVDQVERMPSPYLWQSIEEMEGRFQNLQGQLRSLKQTLDLSKQVATTENFDIVTVIQMQEQSIWKVASDLAQAHQEVDRLRQLYILYEKGDNVLEMEREEELMYQRHVDQQMRMLMVTNLPTSSTPTQGQAPAPSGGLFGSTPASSGGLFGSTPAPSGGLFGSSPAPSGGLFGSNPTPAPSSGGLFGSTPAPAPSGGGLFGGSSTPAPAPSGGGLFGSIPAPAPAFGSSTPAPAPSGSLFGGSSTPAAAPSGGLFGGSTPAAAPVAGGAPPVPSFGTGFSSTSSTPKSKNKGRSTRRR
jgi:hypothetical protein